jgi:Domain of unknown function (DUF3850)
VNHHIIKCEPEAFERTEAGLKLHEVRVDDRNYQTGDLVTLQEWIEDRREYTGRMSTWRIGHLTRGGTFGMPRGLCAFSLLPKAGAETQIQQATAKMLLRMLVSHHKDGLPVPDHWWETAEVIALSGISPLRATNAAAHDSEGSTFRCCGAAATPCASFDQCCQNPASYPKQEHGQRATE